MTGSEDSDKFYAKINTNILIDELLSMEAIIRAIFKIVGENRYKESAFGLKTQEIVTSARAEILNHQSKWKDIPQFSIRYLANNLMILLDIHQHNQQQLNREKPNKCPKCNHLHDLECEECEPEYLNKAEWEKGQEK